jgi:hypothetical protein
MSWPCQLARLCLPPQCLNLSTSPGSNSLNPALQTRAWAHPRSCSFHYSTAGTFFRSVTPDGGQAWVDCHSCYSFNVIFGHDGQLAKLKNPTPPTAQEIVKKAESEGEKPKENKKKKKRDGEGDEDQERRRNRWLLAGQEVYQGYPNVHVQLRSWPAFCNSGGAERAGGRRKGDVVRHSARSSLKFSTTRLAPPC